MKRLTDCLLALVTGVLLSPVLVLAALAIVLEDGRPVLFRQARVGLQGRVFGMFKFRSMVRNAASLGGHATAEGDPRITRVGRFLRRPIIDELPHLLNVLNGDMSFVGPRPERPEFVAQLGAVIPLYNERHMVKAGLTGWAQINYPYGASVDDARSKLSYDLYYVKNFSILFDFVILLQTLRVVLWPSGVR